MDAARIRSGDLRALGRAATAIENRTPAAQALMAELFPSTGRALIVGLTGPPGAGKSTLADQLIASLRAESKTVAVIAIDPSSPFSQGAILGDRIRMQRHHADPGVFIRSTASRGKLGGLTRATLELSWLFDAAGRDVILVETLGVGQDEIDIAQLADVVVVVLAPGFGDDVQAIKAGIMEIADVFAVNKSDLLGADRLAQEIAAGQSLAVHSQAGDVAPICRVTASTGSGIDALLQAIRTQAKPTKRSPDVWAYRLREMLRESVLESLPESVLREHAARVAAKMEDPYTAVAALRSTVLNP